MSTFNRSEKQKSNRILNQMDGEKRRRVRDLASLTASSRDNPLATYLLTTPGAGTWSKPDFGTKVEVWACGGGGGGGSGRKGAAGTNRAGGSPGFAAAPVYVGTYDMESFPNQITFTIGDGGLGGASQTTNSTNGISGVSGTATTVSIGGVSVFAQQGGLGGGGGTSPTATTAIDFGIQTSPLAPFRFLTDSSSGGSILSTNVETEPRLTPSVPGVAPAPFGGNALLDASTPSPYPLAPLIRASRGGQASSTGNAQAGGNGVLGLGGAGGGASVDSVGDSGAGGRGGSGFVYIIVY